MSEDLGRTLGHHGFCIYFLFFSPFCFLVFCIWIIFPGDDGKLFPDRHRAPLLRLAGCRGPYNKQTSHFETHFGSFFLSSLDVNSSDVSSRYYFIIINIISVCVSPSNNEAFWIPIVPFHPSLLGCFVDSDW